MQLLARRRTIATAAVPEDVAARDRAWVERIRAGDAAAFDALCRAYVTPLYEYAFRYVHAEDVARDLVQDVCFRLWTRRAQWDVRGTAATYLFGAVRNAALSYLRHDLVARRWMLRASAELRVSDGGAPRADDVHDRLEREELAARIQHALEALTPKQRLAITLRWQRHLTNPEVASVMGTSVTAVELLFSRALKALRAQLAGLVG